MATHHNEPLAYGLKNNSHQLFQWLLQVFFVGLMLGTTRIVITPLAEQEFGLAKDSLLLLSTFVIAFGVVKGCMNFVAGYWAEKIGRKPVHLLGWLIAWPYPTGKSFRCCTVSVKGSIINHTLNHFNFSSRILYR